MLNTNPGAPPMPNNVNIAELRALRAKLLAQTATIECDDADLSKFIGATLAALPALLTIAERAQTARNEALPHRGADRPGRRQNV